ncbi:MAG: hypothetical protein CMP21_05975 [Rickettsiales bacterium]|nr:hypothetical protein [Rickettsiales bacterium]|tara:strand:+ start:2989 stop:4035 length:1047 start_codon:yes stop_codon:yes gene_type:complete
MSFLNYFFIFVSLFSTLNLMLFSLILFIKSFERHVNLLLGCYFFIVSFLFLRVSFYGFMFSDGYGSFYFDFGLILLLSILFYLIRKDHGVDYMDLLHSVPILLFVGFLGVINFFDSFQFLLANGLFVKGVFFLVLMLVYSLYLQRSRFFVLFEGSALSDRSFFHFFFMGIHISIPVLALGLISYHQSLLVVYVVFVTVMVLFLVFDLMFNYFQEISSVFTISEDKSYQKSHLSNLDLPQLEKELYSLMVEDKVFKDPLLSLKLLANMLNVSSHQLSEYLNNVKQKSFSHYLMIFRVEEAKDLLVKYDWRTTLSIGAECGFNSHSSFSRCFKVVTGVSPGIYRSENACG